MRSFFRVIFLLACTVLFLSCRGDKEGEVPSGELIKSISAEINPENALRMNVAIDFKKDVDYDIEYWKRGDKATAQRTQSAKGSALTEVVLLFLEPDTEYDFCVRAATSKNHTVSDIYTFKTGLLPGNIPTYMLTVDKLQEDINGYILLTKRDSPGFISLIDTKGNVVWYESVAQGVRVATFDSNTNSFTAVTGGNPNKQFAGNGILVVDIFGNKLMERESSELFPHHDSRRLPSGDVIVVNYVPREFDLTSVGGGAKDIVWGDGYSIMGLDGVIKKQWDCFGELNPIDDPSILQTKGDWLHANSVNFDSQGNYYMTFNKPSEMWKITSTTGKVNYRVGRSGNTQLAEEYFAKGLHSPYPISPNEVLVFDNGSDKGISRALIYKIDEVTKKVTVSMEIKFPGEISAADRSNAVIVKDDLVLVGSAGAMVAAFTNFKGEILRKITCPYTPYRAEYIPQIIY